MKLFLLLFVISFVSAAHANNTIVSEWVEITDVEAVKLVAAVASPLANWKPKSDDAPNNIEIFKIGGRRGFMGHEAWVQRICQVPMYKPCIPDDESQLVNEDSRFYGHYYLSERSNSNAAADFHFSKVLQMRMTKIDQKITNLEFQNQENQLLKMDIRSSKVVFNYTMGNNSTSFTINIDGSENFIHKIGEVISLPLYFFLPR